MVIWIQVRKTKQKKKQKNNTKHLIFIIYVWIQSACTNEAIRNWISDHLIFPLSSNSILFCCCVESSFSVCLQKIFGRAFIVEHKVNE
jgi:hypothetical protein